MASSSPALPDTLVTLKVNFQGSTRRFKLPLRDLGVNVFEDKIRAILCISPEANATFERYSDSASCYVVLDPSNQSVWKQLFRAAKAKQKLKLRVSLQDSEEEDNRPKPVTVEDEPEQESRDFAQTKPEAPLISTTPADVPEPVVEASEPYNPAPTLHEAPREEEDTMQKLMETALTRLSLDQQEAAQPQCAQPSETTTSVFVAPKAANFAVCCNNCDRTIPDSHYHCSTCDDGDFDLCPDCVERGVTCYNSDHWLLKRVVRGDVILVSTTERVAPKPKAEEEVADVIASQVKPVPELATSRGAPPVSLAPPVRLPVYRTLMRTCNSCVQELPDKEFLHCTTCEDFDLCKACFSNDQHGHHPQHGFVPAVEGTPMPAEISRRLAPGRDQRHYAICDGCDKFIYGVRHKCLDCPDWDYCAACVVNAGFIHPNHRFVPIYDQIADARSLPASRPCHYGICCDGPLCNGKRKTYIVGERYKCTVCHDTDFCANCEASPTNTHNRTHPLIKFKTPVRRVEVTTKGENEHGQKMPVMGDRLIRKPVVPQLTDPSLNSRGVTTCLRTVVDVKPEPEAEVEKSTVVAEQPLPVPGKQVDDFTMHKILLAQQQKQQRMAKERLNILAQSRHAQHVITQATRAQDTPESTADKLIAVFERDTVADGTVMAPNQVFEQTWVLRNGGDVQWPAGCSVKFVGGDYMGHIDSSHPAGIRDLLSASESTVSYDSVAPGEEFSFTVLLRTPAREGKVISWWRLTTKDGHKFGHRLWCDVNVQAPKIVEDAPTQVKEEIPEVKDEAVAAEQKTQESAESSQMIFPKLEKESPEASTHEDVKSEVAEAVEESDGFEDCGEDEEWAEESDNGFLTDEEYDILDASDEEFSDDQQKKMQKK